MQRRIIAIFSWVSVGWITWVFLNSIPYKFSNSPDTQHIFGTIGLWMEGILGQTFGKLFANYAAYIVGSIELITSVILLLPLVFFILVKVNFLSRAPIPRSWLHCGGGFLAGAVMAGAAFFHLFTPLGIVVLHNGQSDGGSLFTAAVSICVLGFAMSILNYKIARENCLKST